MTTLMAFVATDLNLEKIDTAFIRLSEVTRRKRE